MPDECLNAELTDEETEALAYTDMQAVIYSVKDAEQKEMELQEISKLRRRGKATFTKGIGRKTNYPKYVYTNTKKFGDVQNAIKYARKQRNLSCRQLAELIGGISGTAISYWENGRSKAKWGLLLTVMPELKGAAEEAKRLYDEHEMELRRNREKRKVYTYHPQDVKRYREKHGLSSEEFAAAVGVTAGTVRRWEMPSGKPNRGKIMKAYPDFERIVKGEDNASD